MIRCFVLPRLLYGLDVIRLTKTDIKNLSTYYVQLLKQIQHLPVRTSCKKKLKFKTYVIYKLRTFYSCQYVIYGPRKKSIIDNCLL